MPSSVDIVGVVKDYGVVAVTGHLMFLAFQSYDFTGSWELTVLLTLLVLAIGLWLHKQLVPRKGVPTKTEILILSACLMALTLGSTIWLMTARFVSSLELVPPTIINDRAFRMLVCFTNAVLAIAAGCGMYFTADVLAEKKKE